MLVKKIAMAALTVLSLANPGLAGDTASIVVSDAYARSSTPTATSGAAYLVLANTGGAADRLVSVNSQDAARVELHTHVEDANGVMQMRQIEDGIAIPQGGSHTLKRGGDHVMIMGLKGPWQQGDVISLTLVFEIAGDVVIKVPVDLTR